jgi:FKBP-type peptidyl-prolyl cis-trans isomerase (trigger factor)
MTEEMILLERADELGITMTDSQVENALKDIKRDYPDNVFQEILLEYAIPYQSWKEGLKTRLLIEKLITQELGDKIEITQDDISKYYEEHLKDDDTSPDVKAVSKDINDTIIKILRKEKMEKAYASWIKKLKNKYAIEINKKELEKMTRL